MIAYRIHPCVANDYFRKQYVTETVYPFAAATIVVMYIIGKLATSDVRPLSSPGRNARVTDLWYQLTYSSKYNNLFTETRQRYSNRKQQ